MLLLFALATLAGCTPLKPWQRGLLVQRCMKRSLSSLETAMNLHVHEVRESALGAAAGGGVSCGCN